MSELRFRQVHLDFHTSEKITNVGDKFDKKQFQRVLQQAHVNSITLFSKCHHGLNYHKTKVGVRHPGMKDDLLPRQLEACAAIGIKTPIYLSAGIDDAMAVAHPEWTVKARGGTVFDPTQARFKRCCFNTPYLDYLCAQIEEVIDLFDANDGIWLDMANAYSCYCKNCMIDMQNNGFDPEDEEQVRAFGHLTLEKYFQRITESCRKDGGKRNIFTNSGFILRGGQQAAKWNTHHELESLPTGGWGYDHLPLSAKYAATTNKQYLGMTGKFHTTWGEFGGYKQPNALRYECMQVLALGAKCGIGDQLHPSGMMDEDTYRLIGKAYREVETKEPWCCTAHAVAEIALVAPEVLLRGKSGHFRGTPAGQGASRMLLELHQQYDVVDLDHDLSSYKLVILPDEFVLNDDFGNKIKAYLAGGGKLLLSGKSGLRPDLSRFALDLGMELAGHGQYDPDYVAPTELTPTPFVRGYFVVHGGAWNVRALNENIEVLAHRADTYFNRAWNHFCSHQHSPHTRQSKFPAIVGTHQWVYFAHNIFSCYRQLGQTLYRDLVQDALARLLPDPIVQTNLPSAARVYLTQQASKNRYILHLLFAVPEKRGADAGNFATGVVALEVIEDLYPLHNITCRVRISKRVQSVKLAPSGEELDFSLDGGVVYFTVPKLHCHQMIEINY